MEYTYGTARFELQARMCVAGVHFVVRYKHFSKLCNFVGNCTENFACYACTRDVRVIHAHVTSEQ